MRPEEISGLGDLAGEAAAGTALQIHELHTGIAGRVWRSLGPLALPVRIVHDTVARHAYTLAGELTRGAVRAGTRAVGAATAPNTPALEESVIGRAAVGALNGACGDMLERRGNPLALQMTIRRGGRDVELAPESLRRAYPTATSRLVVFLHGLGQTDEAWMLGAPRQIPYGFRLHAELGYSPVYVRYNSGRHISDNGRELAQLLDRLTDAWPVEVQEIALVGHSVGGLLARSACHYNEGGKWCSKVRHVFTLASPHGGARVEQLANLASATLRALPETRGVATAINLRSAGMKDLRFGYLVDECWAEEDDDAFLRNRAREIPFLPTANHYFVGATVSRDPEGLLGRILGDLVVLRASAWGQSSGRERMRFPVDHYLHLGGAHHFQLLNHPAVYQQIRRWLTSRKALPVPAD